MTEKSLSIAQVVEITGLPASTIRYYDQQFGEFLGIRRGAGRRRDFSRQSVELLLKVRSWLNDEGLSLRQVRARLDQGEGPVSHEAAADQRQDMERMVQEMRELRRQLDELKDIQQKTLNILSGLIR